MFDSPQLSCCLVTEVPVALNAGKADLSGVRSAETQLHSRGCLGAPESRSFSPRRESATLPCDRSTETIRLPEPSRSPAAATVRKPRFGRLAVNPTTVALSMNSASGPTPRRRARMEFVRAISAANPPNSRRRSSEPNRRGDRTPSRGDGGVGGCRDLGATSLESAAATGKPLRGVFEMRSAR